MASASSTFALAHLSDPHLAGWSVGNIGSLLNKRLTGWLSWRSNRKFIHQSRVLDMVVEDLAARGADHVAVTGDLVNISLPDEFARAALWLNRLGDGDRVTVVPGNHDAYVAVNWARGAGQWSSHMTNRGWQPEGAAPTGVQSGFPFVRRIGPLALVGVSTALPMPPFIAAGRLGAAQLEALARTLSELRAPDTFRVVLIHHPPFAGGIYKRKALLDAGPFQDVIRAAGAELVLHGHMHVASLGQIGATPVIGVPSASAIRKGHKDAAAYNLYRVGEAGPNWRLSVEIRGLAADQARIAAAGGYVLTIPRAAG
jgi:3',5'-cyclic AMP phosphodiesterase CpdA